MLGVYPDGYQPYMTYVARDAAAAGGLKFSTPTIGSFDFGVSCGRNETARYTDSTINPSYGPDSPTSFYLGSWKDDTTSVTLDYLRNVRLARRVRGLRPVRCIATSSGRPAISAIRSATRAARSAAARWLRCMGRAASTTSTPRSFPA